MKKVINIYNHLEEYLLVILLAIMVVIVFVQVIMRFVVNSSLTWSEELARIMFIWISWLGISYAEKKGEHIKINILTDRLKGNAQKAVLIIADICTLGILMFLFVEGSSVTSQIMNMGSHAASLPIPNWMIYISVPVGCGLMAIRVIKNIVFTVTERKSEEVA